MIKMRARKRRVKFRKQKVPTHRFKIIFGDGSESIRCVQGCSGVKLDDGMHVEVLECADGKVFVFLAGEHLRKWGGALLGNGEDLNIGRVTVSFRGTE